MPDPLPPQLFRRVDETPDGAFYASPRLVTHIDDGAIAAVTGMYRRWLPAGGRVLDLMSSWVSHLPADVAYGSVTGLGMNRVELDRNPRLAERVVHDLNADPRLPFGDAAFDAAVCCVSIDYLVRPVEVVREVGRVLTPGGAFVVTFSNRCFPTKAVAAWGRLDDAGRVALVARYFADSGGFGPAETIDVSPQRGDPLFAVIGRKGG